MALECKRVYVGGLPPGVSTDEVAERFSKFGQVSGIDIHTKKTDDGEVFRTFAHLSLKLKESDWKKCLTTYNKTKWKGHEMIVQQAKESFLTKLEKEREVIKEECKEKSEITSKIDKTQLKYELKGAKPGTEVEGQKDWIVGKYGQVLPVVKIRRKDKKKIVTIDPSKLVHNVKKLDKNESSDQSKVEQLTWEMDVNDNDITKKRKGIFPEYSPKKKNKKVIQVKEKDSCNEVENNHVEFDTVPVTYEGVKFAQSHDTDGSCDSADTDEIIAAGKKNTNKRNITPSTDGSVKSVTQNNAKLKNMEVESISESSGVESKSPGKKSKLHVSKRFKNEKDVQLISNKNISSNSSFSEDVSSCDDSDNSGTDENKYRPSKHKQATNEKAEYTSSSDSGITSQESQPIGNHSISVSNNTNTENYISESESESDSSEKSSVEMSGIPRNKEKLQKESQKIKNSATDILNKMMNSTIKGEKLKEGKKKKKKKHMLDNEKRLESMKHQQQAVKNKTNLIKQALASVDSGTSQKKIVFDSDSEDERLMVTNKESDLFDDRNEPDKIKKEKPLLFDEDSGSEGDTESDAEDNVTFRIRPEYEGKAGKKLMKLQSRFNQDERFKMDQKFLDSDSEDDSSIEPTKVTASDIEPEEKDRALAILESVVGPSVKDKKPKKHFKDVSTLHYDPDREDHAQFEIKESPEKSSKKEKKSKKKKDKMIEETPVVPEVSKETFYEVTLSLKDMFGGDKGGSSGFSLLSQFGQPEENDITQESTSKDMTTQEMLGWKSQDSSDEGTESREKQDKKNSGSVSANKEAVEKPRNKFFIDADDPRVAEGIEFFHCKEDPAVVREKWLEVRPKMIDLYKLRRRRAIRNQKSLNELRLGKETPKRKTFDNKKSKRVFHNK